MIVHRLKLRPPQPSPAWLDRSEIAGRLRPGIGVLSVVAGPGYGKTVLAALLYERWKGPTLWYSLDEGDGDLAIFGTHLLALLDGVGRSGAVSPTAWRNASPKDVALLFAEALAGCEASPLLVFDDVHVLEGTRALGALDELVERVARVGGTVVLCGRSMPVALHPVAASARLASVASTDLAFDGEQALRFLESATRLSGDRERLAELARRAEGWPAGLALVATAAAAHARGPEIGAGDEETRRLLFEYLATEVLGTLDDDERSFLLETAILGELEVALCNRVTGRADASERLASLARRGLFITRRSDDAYTAHQLFREFLRHQLGRAEAPEAIAVLHARAAAAYAERADHPAAIAHLLEAGDLDAAAAALEASAFALIDGGLLRRVDVFLRGVGAQRVEGTPTLLVARGRLEYLGGDYDRALVSLEQAIALAGERGEDDVRAEGVRVLSTILGSRREFARLLALLGETLALGERLAEGSRVALRVTLGAVLIETGRYDEALALYDELLPVLVARGDLALQGVVFHNTGVARMRSGGDPYATLVMFERALKIKRSVGQRVSALVTLSEYAYITRELGDLEAAERATQTLCEDAADIGNPTLVAKANENHGANRLLRGDPAGAAAAFQAAQRALAPGDILVLPDVLHGLARALLELGKVVEAEELCAQASALVRGAPQRQQAGPLLLTRAACAVAGGDYERALAFASEANEAGRAGANGLIAAATGLGAAALLVRLVQLEPARAAEAERLAAAAARDAFALLHERDYRFLLRTKAAEIATLHDHLRRWQIGGGFVPQRARRAPMRVEMLGGLAVNVGGVSLSPDAWKRRKAREIFAFLASLRGQTVARARLIDLFWPETDADAAHDNLRVTISAIRKAVGDVIKFEHGGYRFVAPPHTELDIERFDALVEAAREAVAMGRGGAARTAFTAAVELYRGDFLDGIEDGGWQWRERERLRAACLEALRWLAHDEGSEVGARHGALDRLLEIAPFDVDAVRLRLRRLADELRLEEAERDYASWRARYRATIGSEAPDLWRRPAGGPQPVRRLSRPGA